jgi:hypothetical protein
MMGRRKRSENRLRTESVHVRMTPAELMILRAVAARTGKPEARLLREAFTDTVPREVFTWVERYVPSPSHHPGNLASLQAENERRVKAAGHRDAGAATMILARFAATVTPRQRLVAEARIADPEAPWSKIAARLGMTKDEAIGVFRRMLKAAEKQAEV